MDRLSALKESSGYAKSSEYAKYAFLQKFGVYKKVTPIVCPNGVFSIFQALSIF